MYKCDDEMKGVETLVDMLSAGGIPHLTRFRAPYGEPLPGRRWLDAISSAAS